MSDRMGRLASGDRSVAPPPRDRPVAVAVRRVPRRRVEETSASDETSARDEGRRVD